MFFTPSVRLYTCSLLALVGLSVASCESGLRSPASPSAADGTGSTAAAADGSTLKVTVPTAVDPVGGVPGINTNATLLAWQSRGRYYDNSNTSFPHRFEVSDSSSFANLVSTGTGTNQGDTLVRYQATLPAGRT